MKTEEIIIGLERDALNNWADGNPRGYFVHAAEDMTYFDDIGAQSRLEGLDTIDAYATTLESMITEHKYDMVDPKVQVYGNMAIITLFYHPASLDGDPLTKWRTTTVYVKINSKWKMVHANWTMEKAE